MVAHPDIFEQRERLGKWMVGSLVLHAAIVAAFLVQTFVHGPMMQMGDPRGGGFGAVAVNTVAVIPLPSNSGPTNPVANPTESKLPTPPPTTKAKPKVTTPDPDAIAIGKAEKNKKKPTQIAEAAPNKFREKQTYQPNQLYSSAGQAMSSPMMGVQGTGGVKAGNSSPFGTQFGYYANILQTRVAQSWKTNDVDPRITSAPTVTVTFTILKDGSVPASSVKISQASGILPLDYSAKRAILDASPFPALPPGFPRSQADIELKFELRR